MLCAGNHALINISQRAERAFPCERPEVNLLKAQKTQSSEIT